VDTDKDASEEYEAVAYAVANRDLTDEVCEEQDVVHEYQVCDLSEDLDPVGEHIFHWVEVDEVVPCDLNECEGHRKLKPCEFRVENDRKHKANSSQKCEHWEH